MLQEVTWWIETLRVVTYQRRGGNWLRFLGYESLQLYLTTSRWLKVLNRSLSAFTLFNVHTRYISLRICLCLTMLLCLLCCVLIKVDVDVGVGCDIGCTTDCENGWVLVILLLGDLFYSYLDFIINLGRLDQKHFIFLCADCNWTIDAYLLRTSPFLLLSMHALA